MKHPTPKPDLKRRRGLQYDLIKWNAEKAELWPVPQLAAFLHISTTSIYRYGDDGKVTLKKIGARRWITIKSDREFWGALVRDFDPLKLPEDEQDTHG